jgi:alkylhydroperoxidase family enzyme
VSTGEPTASALRIAALIEHAPEVDQNLGAFRDAATETVPPRIAELCRLRIAMLHDCDDELAAESDTVSSDEVAALGDWPHSDVFDERDRACLALAEQFVIDVSTTSDDQVAAVAEHMDHGELYGFVHALLALDESQRLRVATERLFRPDSTSSGGRP